MRALAADPSTATARHTHNGLSPVEHLLFLVLDELRTANWQRTKDGAKNRNRPKPTSPLATGRGNRYGRTDRSPAEVAAFLARFDPAKQADRAAS